MAKINTKTINGILCRYVNAQDGIRIYLLPNVPMNVGRIESETDFDLEKAVKIFDVEKQERVKNIGNLYRGRCLDTLSILKYAEEKGRFEEFEKRLKAKLADFEYIHPDLMMARTDVSLFFLQMYADLGIAPKKELEHSKRQLKQYGPGVIVFPR